MTALLGPDWWWGGGLLCASLALVAVLAVTRATGVVRWRGPVQGWAAAELEQLDRARTGQRTAPGWHVARLPGGMYWVRLGDDKPQVLTRRETERALSRWKVGLAERGGR